MSRFALGIALCLLGWLVARRVGRTRVWRIGPMLLDLAVPGACFAFIASGTGRPIFAGLLVGACQTAYAIADHFKRKTLFEPIVCADLITAVDIFRNPRICLIFPDLHWIVLGAATAIGLFGGLYWLDLPALPANIWLACAVAIAVYGAGWLVAGPQLARVTSALQRLQATGNPIADCERFGPFATLLIHGVLSRGERAARRRAALDQSHRAIDLDGATGPIVVIQCESFFDARRLHAGVSRDLVPAFEHCAQGSVQWGRLKVPSVGANSVRTEFAVLTGLDEDLIGFDRFNPYQGFARAELPSLASRLREAGYYTICLHPFDRAFYGRDHVMGNLGFDDFIGIEGFAGAQKVGLYTADVEVARRIAELIKSHGPKVFVFAITMENHGPWQKRHAGGEAVAPGLPELAGARDLVEFLRSVRNSDRMIRILADALAREQGLLAFYGDHLPSFPSQFAALGFTARDTDYLIWRPDQGTGLRVDLPAHGLHEAILQAIAEPAVSEHRRVVPMTEHGRSLAA
ncbi:MAG TPA: LTA synthase family protein [Nevskiaceae bacterium]|nr:LTA synthase family protein [Nevskiaceae bacterium]